MRFAERLILAYYRTLFRVLGALSPLMAARRAFRLFCTPQSRHQAPLTPLFTRAESLNFSFGAHTVYGFRWNAGAARKALLLHGHRSSVTNFEAYVQPLIDEGYEVLAFDAPAHGRSPGKMIHVLTYVQMIEALWQRYGPIDSFVAHSFGGLSLTLALERLPHDVHTRLALIAPAAETLRALEHFFRLLHITPPVRTAFTEVIRRIDGHEPSWYSVRRAMGHIRARVLFLQDEEDRITPVEDLQPLIDRHPANVRFLLTRGLGHRRIYREPSSVRAVIDFLKGH